MRKCHRQLQELSAALDGFRDWRDNSKRKWCLLVNVVRDGESTISGCQLHGMFRGASDAHGALLHSGRG